MERPSRKEIFDALTCESGVEGCDPDWRAEVLSKADPGDLKFVEAQIGRGDELDKETEARLRRSGRFYIRL